MNNNKACAEYFKGNPAYQRCFREFEKKWKSYGRVTGSITLKNTSEEERKAISGMKFRRSIGSVFRQKNDNHAGAAKRERTGKNRFF